jgi:hypothetical protein
MLRGLRTPVFIICDARALIGELGHDATARLVSALVLTRLDCCNAVLTGLSAIILHQQQGVTNVAARLIIDLKPCDYVTAAELATPIEHRILYKLRLLAHLVINGRAPAYLANLLTATARPSAQKNAHAHTGDNTHTWQANIFCFRSQSFQRPSI